MGKPIAIDFAYTERKNDWSLTKITVIFDPNHVFNGKHDNGSGNIYMSLLRSYTTVEFNKKKSFFLNHNL